MKKKIFTLLLALVAATGFNLAQTVDENGIITAPAEGVSKYYTRSGSSFYVSNNSVYSEAQGGRIEIVECVNGDVYFKDIISHYSQNSWVRGTKSDNTITVPVGQPLAYNSQYGTTLSIYWGTAQASGSGTTYAKNADKNEITFTVDDAAGTITLDGSSENEAIGVYWDDDNSWTGYTDYATVWTLDESYVPASTDPVILPDGADIEQWYAFGSDNGESANVAWVGNDVYISGIFANFPDAWIKGTLGDDGSTVTFPKFQYLGEYSPYHIWAVAANQDSELSDIIMHYENTADGRKLTLDADQTLYLNAADDKVYYLTYFERLKLTENAPAPKQIDELPYQNNFDTEELQSDFMIIDANQDTKTWAPYNVEMYYTYSSTNAGDDWLVSPMIKLIAGKVYKISLSAHAESSNYPEKLEVKAAKEATASGAETAALLAAGMEVIEATTITSTSYVTLSNDTFTVAETGYYNFGIHAISDADKYRLTVDDFVVERIVTPDQAAAEAVEALFDALPVADAVTMDDKTAIEDARAAYEVLTDEQKALVTAEELAKLTDAEAALAAAEKEGVENVQGDVKNVKTMVNGQLFILRGEKTYTVTGQEVK